MLQYHRGYDFQVADICRRWQLRDMSQKAEAMVEEEEGSSDVGYGFTTTSWLQVALAATRSKRPLLVVFYSLFCAQDRWQRKIAAGYDVDRLQRKIATVSYFTARDHGREGSLPVAFVPQGSLLVAIKEDDSKRSLLAVLCSERCVLQLKG
ncbi:hypothetical protein B296_00003360 [Ensete ventricosum]|uniref:Uncharacterized protein n=1 Tax=Ensete ventricosum TaxID=4639 RepID=A0A427B9Q7_ENSVE|nr:hypothetical protein B296_00003360 [Ensete ventricosum]